MDLFSDVMARLKHQLRVSKDQEVATFLGISKTAFSERKKRNSFPERELLALAKKRPELGIDTHYVLNGVTAKDTASRMLANFGPRLREVRGDQSPAAFAKRIGVTTSDLAALETGSRAPTTDELSRLQEAHPKHGVIWLFGGDAPKLDTPPNDLEVILLTNYRNSSDQGKEAMNLLAAFYGNHA